MNGAQDGIARPAAARGLRIEALIAWWAAVEDVGAGRRWQVDGADDVAWAVAVAHRDQVSVGVRDRF